MNTDAILLCIFSGMCAFATLVPRVVPRYALLADESFLSIAMRAGCLCACPCVCRAGYAGIW